MEVDERARGFAQALLSTGPSPLPGERAGASTDHNRYGTTIRILDGSTDTWRITWINAVTGKINELSERRG